MKALGFDDMHLFARVAELGTLSAVARERDVPVSQVSRGLARIEKACGARLVHRSTHALALTAEGEIFLSYCGRVTEAIDELEGEFASKAREPGGLVRVAASTVIAEYQLLPSLPGLAARHPRVRVDIDVGDRMLDLARDGIDIAIRTTAAHPGTVVAREIGTLGRALYAAPSYIDAAGVPERPDELSRHRLITNSAVAFLNRWPFDVKGEKFVIEAEGHWRSNDTNMVASMALQGLGIARLSTLAADPLVAKGLLVPVLQGYVDVQPVPVYAVTAGTRHRLPKIKACIDYWADWFGRIPSKKPAR